jgi:hypothetical protein
MKFLYFKLYCILTNKKVYITVFFTRLLQTTDYTGLCDQGDAMYRTHADMTGGA